MKHLHFKSRSCLALALSGALALGLLAGCGAQGTAPTAETAAVTASAEPSAESLTTSTAAAVSAEAVKAVTVDAAGAAQIRFTGTDAEISGSGAQFADGVLLISQGGTYALSGTLSEGRVVVDAKGEDVVLILNGVDLHCSSSSPLYIYKAASAVIELAAGSENRLSDGSGYVFTDARSDAEAEEPNACLYSKADLMIQGSGSLTVEANYKNGISGKDTLRIADASLTVTAVKHGVSGKDCCDLSGVTLTVRCGGDALRSTNDTDADLGWVRAADCVMTLTAGNDGIQAETALELSGGSYEIASGGGSGAKSSDSAKGLKSGGSLVVNDGSFLLDCSDDAIHADGDLSIGGGSFTIASGDDAIHAGAALAIGGGSIAVTTSYEGLEGKTIDISGGELRIVSTDDGINAGGGNGSGGFGGGNSFAVDSSASLTLRGGYVVIAAGGDGFDSNGSAKLSGGTLIVSSTGRADGALDSGSGLEITGGTLIAVGGGMPESPENGGQNSIFLNFGNTLAAGTVVCFENGGKQYAVQLPVSSSTLVFSSPELVNGEITVSYGGDWSGSFTDAFGTDGSYSGGTELCTLNLSGDLASYGSAMGGFGGPGGFGGGQRENGQFPGNGQFSGDGQRPERPTDGQFPGNGQFSGDGQRPERPTDGQFPGKGQFSGDGERPEPPTDGQFPGGGQFPGNGTRQDGNGPETADNAT